MDLKYLVEEQNTAFDEEYHSPAELRAKVELLRKHFGNDGPHSILDLGGGNGKFLDALLAEFPKAIGVIIDVSAQLLALNKPRPNKSVICATIEDADEALAGRQFDLITINWVLHHLVGPSYAASGENCVEALEMCRRHLSPNGVLFVAENLFESVGDLNFSNRLIYAITSIRFRPFVRLARRYFNTAGVGVAFRNEKNWREIIRRAGFIPERVLYRPWSREAGLKGFLIACLGLNKRGQGHFLCRI